MRENVRDRYDYTEYQQSRHPVLHKPIQPSGHQGHPLCDANLVISISESNKVIRSVFPVGWRSALRMRSEWESYTFVC